MKTKSIYCFLMILILLTPFIVASSTIPAPTSLAVGSCPLFPENNFWNTPIDTLPVHPNSAQWISSIGTSDTFHMDFGSGIWDGGPIGIPFNVISGSAVNTYELDFYYPDESDPGLYPLSTSPQIEWGGDHHILTVDTDDCTLYEIFDASYANGQWSGGSGAKWDLNSNILRPDSWTSADAAGLPILPGLARYDEVASGIIEHALRFTANCTANYYIWPARHEAQHGSCTTPVPFGSRFRLKPDYNIGGFSSQAQVLLLSFKTYGIVLADNGSDWYVSGAPSPSWNNNQLHELDVLRGSDFEAVDTSGLMVNYNSGATSSPYVVTKATDTNDGSCDGGDCSLREAIATANSFADADTIEFAADYTITLGSQLPTITTPITITGTTNTLIQANADSNTATYRIFEVGNTGDLTLESLTMQKGRCNGSCTTGTHHGGGIYNMGTLTITDSVISNNYGSYGAGIFNDGTLTVTNSTLSGNSSNANGGSILNNDTLIVANSTFSDNSALGSGGGIFNGAGSLTVMNSTFANNSADFGNGGGIYNQSTLNLKNNILTNSIAGGDCYNSSGDVIASNINNLISTNGLVGHMCGTPTLTSNPHLGSLTGSPAYFPLNAGSPAINAGDEATCTAAPVSNTSQNGMTRPVGNHCDIGSFEFVYKLFLPLTLR